MLTWLDRLLLKTLRRADIELVVQFAEFDSLLQWQLTLVMVRHERLVIVQSVTIANTTRSALIRTYSTQMECSENTMLQ